MCVDFAQNYKKNWHIAIPSVLLQLMVEQKADAQEHGGIDDDSIEVHTSFFMRHKFAITGGIF